MAWPAATTLMSLLMLLLMTIAASFSPRIIATTQAPFGRILKAVKLHGGYMEVIQEQRCSHGLLRLTCRSLKAFVFILEAEYHANRTELCQKESKSLEELKMWRNKGSTRRWTNVKELKGNYVLDDEDQADIVDIRLSLNKRCSGQKHCRYNVTIDHPGAHSWIPGGILLKYACIPEAAVRRYCNQEVKVIGEAGGYINTPGYPLYYLGETCGWTFRTFPGQRIVLTFHDLNIREPNADGNCVDIVRVRERGSTLFEFCGTVAGVRVVSNSNMLTLDFVASKRFYNARGFLLQYQVLGCPEVSVPNGSYVSDGTLTSRTFLCKSGSVFPDSRERKRTLECRNGKWNETATKLPGCVELTKPRGPHNCTRLFSRSPTTNKSILVPTFSVKPTRSRLVRPIVRQESAANLFFRRAHRATWREEQRGWITDATVGGIQRLALFTPSRSTYVYPPFSRSSLPSPVEEPRELPMPAETSSSRHRRS